MTNDNQSGFEIKELSYSYVAVFQQIMLAMPTFSPEFSKDFFGSPETTQFGLGPEGYVIFGNAPTLAPRITIGANKFTLVDLTMDSFLASYQRFLGEIYEKQGVYQKLSIGSIGINIEYQITFTDERALKSISKTFLTDTLGSERDMTFVQLKFQVLEENFSKYVGFDVQAMPRDTNSLFVQVNDHYGVSPNSSFFSIDELKDQFAKTGSKLQQYFLSSLTI